ncbi:MAG: response regulator transcription factor [Pseudomonadota bacterium]
MALDDRDSSPLPYEDAMPGGGASAALRCAAPARLVLFVGTPPPSRVCELLADDGMRSLCLPGPAQALRAATLAHFDALVIDAATLGSRAALWLADLHHQLRCPLVVVAEQADEVDEILALELGADAYLARPLGARRLRAHLAALMRLRRPMPSQGDAGWPTASVHDAATTDTAGWQLDRVANRLSIDGRDIALTEVQCSLLQCLIEAEGRIVPRARLAEALPHGHGLSARSVDVYIHRLRTRLRGEALEQRLAIEAVRGRGYALSGLHKAARDADA